MPVEKRPVVHRFGIFTEARRNELVRKVMTDEGRLYKPELTPRYKPKEIEETISQINNATSDVEILSLEDDAWSLLQKVKYQVSSFDSKKGMDILNKSLIDLSYFISSSSRKLQHESLNILHKLLTDAPLSKSSMSSLLQVVLSTIKVFCREDKPYPWENKYFILTEIIFMVCSRLYYHYLMKDSCDLNPEKLRELYLLNKALKISSDYLNDNIVLANLLQIVNCMISTICPKLVQLPGSAEEANESEHPGTSGESNTESNESQINEGRAPLARFLWYTLKLWKCASRQIEIDNDSLIKLALVDFTDIDTQNKEWLGYVIALNLLCECSKIKIGFLKIFLSFRTKMLPKKGKTTKQVEDKHNITWNLELIIIYLKSLADVCTFGVSIATQKLALLGCENFYGLVDYLNFVPNDENQSKIQLCTYQLLCDVYKFYLKDHMKDGLKNITWKFIMNFKSTQEDNKLLLNTIQNYQTRNYEDQKSVGCVFSKIGTNMCIIAFSTPGKSKEDTDSKTPRRPNNSKCFELLSKKEVKKVVNSCVNKEEQITLKQKLPQEVELWSEVQKLAAEHFEKEVEEDEVEKELLRQKKLLEEEEEDNKQNGSAT